METMQAQLGRDFDRAELRRIKRLWDPPTNRFSGERIWFDRGGLAPLT